MLALIIANLKMMVRNRQTTFWALFFPLLLVVAFGLFDIDGFGSATLAIIDEADTPESLSLKQNLGEIEFLAVHDVPGEQSNARRQVEDGELDYLLVIPEGFGPAQQNQVVLTYASGNRKRDQLVEATVNSLALEANSGAEPTSFSSAVLQEEVEVRQVAYYDVVLLGLVGLGIMTHSIISIAVKISTYRNQSILKRMLVTPLAIWKYFAAEITSHLILALVQAAIILAVGVFLFGAQIHGNVAWIFIIVLLGSLVFLNLGFILSAWANSPSAASGMGNALALPMVFFAGTFFSTASLPWILPQVVQVLPLTPMISAMREVGIESAPLWKVWPQMAALGGWVVVTALAAIKVFRFN